MVLGECGGPTVGMRRAAIAIEANRVPELRDGTSGQDTNSYKTNYAAVAAREPGWTQCAPVEATRGEQGDTMFVNV